VASAAASGHAPPVQEAGVCSGWPKESGFIREVLDRIGDKWTVLIIGTLRDDALRYSQLHALVPGISQRMLTLTLQQLVRDGLITRVAYAEVPPRVEYSLTPMGETLRALVRDMDEWGQAWVAAQRVLA